MKARKQRASLRASRSAHTVLLRMAADEARAQRIRALKEPYGRELTWGEVADYVGVTERSVHGWARTGAMERENAYKLAEFFIERGHKIGRDYIWRGSEPARQPPLLNVLEGDGEGATPSDDLRAQLAALEEQVRLLRAELAAADAEALKRNEAVLLAIRRLQQ